MKYGKKKPPPGAKLNWSHPLTNGLYACWLFNEQAGLTAHDSCGRGSNTVRIPSGVNYYSYPGRTGPCMAAYLPTSTSRASLLTAITSGTTFTIEAWVWPRTFTTTYEAILVEPGGSYGLFLRATSQKMDFYYSGATHVSNSAVSIGAWHHLVVSVDAGVLTFYLDGKPDGTAGSAVSGSLGAIGNDGNQERLDARIDLIRVWVGRALRQQEIRQLMSQPYAMFSRPKNRMISANRNRLAFCASGWN